MWEIDWALYSQHSVIENLLAGGWEPFAATNGQGGPCIWFRRKKQ